MYIHYSEGAGKKALNSYLATMCVAGCDAETMARTVMERLLVLQSGSRSPQTRDVFSPDGFVAKGWAEPHGTEFVYEAVFEGVHALVTHLYLDEHREGFLKVFETYPERRHWIVLRLITDRVMSAEGVYKKGKCPQAWMNLLPEDGVMPLAVRAFRIAFGSRVRGEAEGQLLRISKERGQGKPEGPGFRWAWEKFEEGILLGDAFPQSWLVGQGHAPGMAMKDLEDEVLLDLLRDFLASPEATVRLDDPRLEPLKDWVRDTATPSMGQLKRITGWQSGARTLPGQDRVCHGCGFPVFPHLDRIRYDGGFGLADEKGNSWRVTDLKEGKGKKWAEGESSLRMACLLCVSAKVLVEGGTIRKQGEHGIWLTNHGEREIPLDLIGIFRDASKTLVGLIPDRLWRSAVPSGALGKGESICIGTEGEAFTFHGMPDSRRRQMGRWGLLYHGLVKHGHSVAIGFRHQLERPGLFDVRVPTNQRKYGVEIGRAVVVGARSLAFESKRDVGLQDARSTDQIFKGDRSKRDKAAMVYVAEADAVRDAVFDALNSLREGGRIEKEIHRKETVRTVLTSIFTFLSHEGAFMNETVNLTDEIAFWSGPAIKVFARPNKRANAGETTLAFREAMGAALAAPVDRRMTSTEEHAIRSSAAKATLVERIQTFIKKEDSDWANSVIAEGCARVDRLLKVRIQNRQRMVNAISDGIKQTIRHKLNWEEIASASEGTLEDAIRRRKVLDAEREARIAAQAVETQSVETKP